MNSAAENSFWSVSSSENADGTSDIAASVFGHLSVVVVRASGLQAAVRVILEQLQADGSSLLAHKGALC